MPRSRHPQSRLPTDVGGNRQQVISLNADLSYAVELRGRIDALRSVEGLPAFEWTDAPLIPGVTSIKCVHLTDLREALAAAYVAAGRSPTVYTGASGSAGLPSRRRT